MEHAEVRKMLGDLIPGFAKAVVPVYRLLNWHWGDSKGRNSYVPKEGDIVLALRSLVDTMSLDESGYGSVSTGGLGVFSEPPTPSDSCWNVGIRFSLEHIFIKGPEGSVVFRSIS